MGGGHSVHSSHFQQTSANPEEQPAGAEDERHISISNKMIERLVEDATLAGRAAPAEPAAPRGDYKEKMYMEKLMYLDEDHSQRCKLTAEDLQAIATRIELRASNAVSEEPVCADCKQRVIDCYDGGPRPGVLACSELIGEFGQCVQEAAARRLRARTQREARELARRERHVAHAREHALRDLAPPPPHEETPA